jgi:RNA polymerase sigma factor FliA
MLHGDIYTAKGHVTRDRQVLEYAPLVKRIAYHMMARVPPSVRLDDLIQAGMIGLLDALNRYEEAQGAQFETYAAQRIRGAMLDELREADTLPRGVRRNMRQIEAAVSALEQRLGRAPGEQEVADALNVPLADYQNMLQEARGYQLLYYEDLSDEEDEDFLDRNCADQRPTPFESLADERLRTALVQAIGELPEREKLLMSLYYEQELNLREIGEVLGVTESRVCQLHSQAVARLRSRLKGNF